MRCARNRGIKFRKGTTVTAFEGEDGKVRVKGVAKQEASDFVRGKKITYHVKKAWSITTTCRARGCWCAGVHAD